ncbi:MAG: BolA family protein [Phormidesmis sp.]
MISPDQVKSMITTSLPDAEVAVQDLTGGGDHYQVAIISSAFEGLSLVKRHQLVYQSVAAAMTSEAIHALSLETHTPGEVATAS